MQYNPAQKPCPRCGVALPVDARFCRNCGLSMNDASQVAELPATFAPGYQSRDASSYQSGAPGYQPSPSPWGPPDLYAGGAGQPDSSPWPEDEPRHSRRRRNASRDYRDYGDDEPRTPKRSFWSSLWGIVVIVLLLVMVGGVAGFAIYFYPSLCSLQQRQGLRQDVPLPCGLTFQQELDRSNSATGAGSTEWVYTVDGTTPDQITSFYTQHLPPDGWTIPSATQQNANGLAGVLACKADMALLVHGSTQKTTEGDFTFSPPSGGSLLLIFLIPLKNGAIPTGTCPGF